MKIKKTMKPVKVALILPIYDGIVFLPDLFASLQQIKITDFELKIFAVNDCSPDNSIEFIRQQKNSYVEIINNKQNLGFVRTNEVGYEYSKKWEADYVYLLNQDTIVDPTFLIEAIKVFSQKEFNHKKIGAVQSKMIMYPEKSKINTIGNALHFLGFGYCSAYRQDNNLLELSDIEEISGYPSGGAVLLKVSILESIGGLFEKNLWMYHEDLELGWRLLLAGYQTVLASRSIVYHKYEFSRSITKFYWMERNRFLVLFEHYRFLTLILLTPVLILMEFYMLIMSIKNGWFTQRIKMYIFFINPLTWGRILKRRREISAIRKVGDRIIFKQMVSKIDFQEVDSFFVRVGNFFLTSYYKLLLLVIWW